MAVSLLNYAYDAGFISGEQKKKADNYKAETGASDENVIRDMKLMTEEKLAEVYQMIYGYEAEYEPDMPDYTLAKRFRRSDLLRYEVFPVLLENRIRLYTAQPASLLYVEDMIRDETGYKSGFSYILTTVSAVTRMIELAFKDESGEVDSAEFDIEGETLAGNTIYDVSESDSSTVVNWVNRVFREAVENRISDIHFEPQEDGFYIRYREDGSLRIEHKLPMNTARQIINRIKTMSNLDVNTSKSIQDVSMLGFSKENEEKFLKIIQRPKGIILLTGPTGSGKSTSLYAALSALNTPDKCIITFEDPVEYRIPGIVQVQINPPMGVTFPQALKSGLRQDIEVALVGEIRDRETASIAFDAANTGHMVFSTLHTNSAASSILRLVKMGVEPYMVSSTLIAVINQRLAKRICPYCKEEYYLENKGRVAIQEFLIINEEMGELLDRGGTTLEIEQMAVKNGMKKIQQDGIDKALSGITTLDEIHRTVFFDNL